MQKVQNVDFFVKMMKIRQMNWSYIKIVEIVAFWRVIWGEIEGNLVIKNIRQIEVRSNKFSRILVLPAKHRQ